MSISYKIGANPVNLAGPTGMSSECANRGHRGIEDLEAYLVECGSQTALTHKTDPRKELTREKDKGEEDLRSSEKSEAIVNETVNSESVKTCKNQPGCRWDLWGKGTVAYDGKGLGGTSYIGPGPDIDPRILKRRGIEPKDELDRAAYYHDIAYHEEGTGGLKGATDNLEVLSADVELVAAARDIINRYENVGNSSLDLVTGMPISQRTYRLAKAVNEFFTPIVIRKMQTLAGMRPKSRTF